MLAAPTTIFIVLISFLKASFCLGATSSSSCGGGGVGGVEAGVP